MLADTLQRQEVESWLNEWTQKLVVAQTNYVETFGPNAVSSILAIVCYCWTKMTD